ncbi:Ger(x)C family spore germination protein [Paenibacillus sp. GCM10012307]|uniref:Ger(X)C family spore germination protein n=1 Tax=Paenibacillus roseus TaxID=2798579 RepID=A0A934MPF5_9BACL|nr:Ger(x)C family spore germination protein [Paenibacillus roseus]MBJ6362021.1 Ger(x)C family spore germination protein [Paenibacillus roseus]
MRHLIFTVLFVFIASLVLGGCGFKDIDKRFFVVATGIDHSDNPNKPFRVTLRLAVTSPKIEPGAGKSQLETIDAKTIAEGVRELKAYVDKELDFGHCKIFMIGEKLARKEMDQAINWMTRRRDIQMIANVTIGHPTAEAILKIQPKNERYPGNTLFLSFGKEGTDSSYTVTEYIFGMRKRRTEKGIDPVLPIIMPENETYRISQAGVLNKKKLIIILSPEETQLYNQITNKYLKSSLGGNVEQDPYVLAVGRIQSRFKIKNNAQGKPVVEMRIKIHGLLEEAPKLVFDKDWASIEQELAKQYSKSVVRLLKKFQRQGVDPIGFGLKYRATHYSGGDKSWQEWQGIYPNIEFDVQTRVTIEGTGLIK